MWSEPTGSTWLAHMAHGTWLAHVDGANLSRCVRYAAFEGCRICFCAVEHWYKSFLANQRSLRMISIRIGTCTNYLKTITTVQCLSDTLMWTYTLNYITYVTSIDVIPYHSRVNMKTTDPLHVISAYRPHPTLFYCSTAVVADWSE